MLMLKAAARTGGHFAETASAGVTCGIVAFVPKKASAYAGKRGEIGGVIKPRIHLSIKHTFC
jgi:hypothetical protein